MLVTIFCNVLSSAYHIVLEKLAADAPRNVFCRTIICEKSRCIKNKKLKIFKKKPFLQHIFHNYVGLRHNFVQYIITNKQKKIHLPTQVTSAKEMRGQSTSNVLRMSAELRLRSLPR